MNVFFFSSSFSSCLLRDMWLNRRYFFLLRNLRSVERALHRDCAIVGRGQAGAAVIIVPLLSPPSLAFFSYSSSPLEHMILPGTDQSDANLQSVLSCFCITMICLSTLSLALVLHSLFSRSHQSPGGRDQRVYFVAMTVSQRLQFAGGCK